MGNTMNRRSFLKGAVAGTVGLAAAGLFSGALAENADGTVSFNYADCINWNAEYDVVVVGFGGAGAVASITAA